jgi:hypothetical protein
MNKYRIVSNGYKFKIQRRFFFLFWIDYGDIILGDPRLRQSVTYYEALTSAESVLETIKISDEKWNDNWQEVK